MTTNGAVAALPPGETPGREPDASRFRRRWVRQLLSSRSGAGASERRCPVAVTIYRHLISGARRRLGDTGHRAVVVPIGFARRPQGASRPAVQVCHARMSMQYW